MTESINLEKSKGCSCCCANCSNRSSATHDKCQLEKQTCPEEVKRSTAPTSTDECRLEKQTCQDEMKRLKESYDEMVNRNQELEAKLLQMAEELQVERGKFQQGLFSMAEKLVDATETINRMERENVQNRKDCNLVVQLLKCQQSLDKNRVLKEVEKLSSSLQKQFCEELNLQLPTAEGRKQQRSLSTSDLYSPPERQVPLKSILKKRSKSTVDAPIVSNGRVTFKEDLPSYKKKSFWIFPRSKQAETENGINNNPTQL